MKKYFFTFGSDPQFPYSREEYVVVEAENMGQATNLFKAVHPNRPNSNFLNCSSVYFEDEFLPCMLEKYYGGKDPIETISVKRRA